MSGPRPAVERRQPPQALMRVVNPMVRRLIQAGRGGDDLLLLHYTGRRSGRQYDVPVGSRVLDGTQSVFTSSRWRANFRGGRTVEVTRRGRRSTMDAQLLEDPATVAKVLHGLIRDRGVTWARRNLGIRVNAPGTPTEAEVRLMVERSGFSILRLTPQEGREAAGRPGSALLAPTPQDFGSGGAVRRSARTSATSSVRR